MIKYLIMSLFVMGQPMHHSMILRSSNSRIKVRKQEFLFLRNTLKKAAIFLEQQPLLSKKHHLIKAQAKILVIPTVTLSFFGELVQKPRIKGSQKLSIRECGG